MTRAILLSAGGDPLLAAFTIKLIKERVWDEIDSLYVCYNNSTETPPPAQAEFLASLIGDEKIKIIYWPTQLGYGLPITKMVQVCTEDLVCLLEDDGFLFTPGKVKEVFDRIESGECDVLGSPRFSCGFEISEAAKMKYRLDYSGYGDRGPNFWPNFFFCKRADLLRTDLDCAPHSFDKDKFYPELNHSMGETQGADTFVWISLQLRHLGLRIGEIPQFHASPFEIDEFNNHERNWKDGQPYWMHGGSLSVGAGQLLNYVIPDVSTDIAKQEIETRVAFWTIVSSTVEGLEDYKYTYQKGIQALINNCQLDGERISRKIAIYRGLMKV